jgi:hypothetical protein
MFYKPLLNEWHNQDKAAFDSFSNYPIDAGAFLLNLPDIMTAQQENPSVTEQESPAVNGYLLNSPERFKLQNYSSSELICHCASNAQWKKIGLPTIPSSI